MKKSQCSQCLDDIHHPMGQAINKLGLCTGCMTHQEKDVINWDERWEELERKCSELLNKRGGSSQYDCVIPLNADAEDYYIVELAMSLRLRPLLVYVNNYFGTDLSWRNLHNLETYFDLDMITFNPNLNTYKEAVRTSLRKFNSIYWPYQAIKTSYPVRLALDMDIPLILWGGLQATEQVGKFSHDDRVEMSGWSRIQHDLFAVDEASFFGTGAQISKSEQFHYTYPDPSRACRVTGIYLSNYTRWDPWSQNQSVLRYGFIPEKSQHTFDQYERAGSSVFYGIHDLLRLEKRGYLKVRDHLSREIRHGRILKGNAEHLYSKYLGRKVDIRPFFDWLGATDSGLKLFVKERVRRASNKIAGGVHKRYKSMDEDMDFKLDESFFDESFFEEDSKSINKSFIVYHKGI